MNLTKFHMANITYADIQWLIYKFYKVVKIISLQHTMSKAILLHIVCEYIAYIVKPVCQKTS